MDGIFGLQQSSRCIIRLPGLSSLSPLAGFVFVIGRRVRRGNVEDVSQGVLHLGYSVVFQDDDQLAILFRLLQAFRLAAVVILQSDDGIGITLIVGNDDRDMQLTGRFRQAVAAHPEGIDAQRLHDGRWVIYLGRHIDALGDGGRLCLYNRGSSLMLEVRR